MAVTRVPLRNFVKEYSVRNKNNEEIPVYSVTNSQGFCTEYFGKEVASQDKTTYKIVPKGYFAYNPSRINVGSVDWQRTEERVIVSPLYNVFSVTDEIDRQYLYYFLKSNIGRQMIKAKASGSVRDNLKLEMLKEMTIPDISVTQQSFEASVLDRLQLLIQLRQKELQQLDELIKARFVEMFGDPVSNEKGWDQVNMKAVCTKITDGEHGSVPRETTGHPFLNAKHIKQDGSIDWESISFISDEVHQKIYKRCNPEPGDILMTTTGTIGNVAITPETEAFSMDRGITLLKIDRSIVNSAFVTWLLRFEAMQSIMKANIHASAIGHLFLNKVEQLPVIVPPLMQQDNFAAFCDQVGKSKVIGRALDFKPTLLLHLAA